MDALGARRNPFLLMFVGVLSKVLRRKKKMKNQTKKTVIAYRKKCQARGTGLSHYILMDRKAK